MDTAVKHPGFAQGLKSNFKVK